MNTALPDRFELSFTSAANGNGIRITKKNLTNHLLREILIGFWSTLDGADRADFIGEILHYAAILDTPAEFPDRQLPAVAETIRLMSGGETPAGMKTIDYAQRRREEHGEMGQPPAPNESPLLPPETELPITFRLDEWIAIDSAVRYAIARSGVSDIGGISLFDLVNGVREAIAKCCDSPEPEKFTETRIEPGIGGDGSAFWFVYLPGQSKTAIADTFQEAESLVKQWTAWHASTESNDAGNG